MRLGDPARGILHVARHTSLKHQVQYKRGLGEAADGMRSIGGGGSDDNAEPPPRASAKLHMGEGRGGTLVNCLTG